MEKPALTKTLKKNLPAIVLAFLGALGGYLYYRFVGCLTGACPLTASPVISTLYGGALGMLAGFVLTPEKKK